MGQSEIQVVYDVRRGHTHNVWFVCRNCDGCVLCPGEAKSGVYPCVCGIVHSGIRVWIPSGRMALRVSGSCLVNGGASTLVAHKKFKLINHQQDGNRDRKALFVLEFVFLMRSVWHKRLAILLLLWAVVDLSVPEMCQAEDLTFSSPTHSTLIRGAGGNGDQNPVSPDDDCFCCCTHIIPTAHIGLAAFVVSTPEFRIFDLNHPQGFTPAIYLPPRS